MCDEWSSEFDPFHSPDIDAGLIDYLSSASERLSDPFEDDDERQLFVNNTFSETAGSEVDLSQHRVTSQALERLIPQVSDAGLAQFAEALRDQLVLLALSPYASHVLQCVLTRVTARVQCGAAEQCARLEQWVLAVADVLLTEWSTLAVHQYGSHVVRTCLECLAGCLAPPQLTHSKRNLKVRSKLETVDSSSVPLTPSKSPQLFSDKLVQVVRTIKRYPELSQSLLDPNMSATVQVALHVLHTAEKAELCAKLIRRLSKLGFGGCMPENSDDLPTVFQEQGLQRVLEVALICAGPEVFAKIYRKYYAGRLTRLLSGAMTRISVQKLVEACPSPDVLETLLDEIAGCEDKSWWTSSRIPTSIAQACIRLLSHQAKFIQVVSNLCECESQEHMTFLVPCILYCTTRSRLAVDQDIMMRDKISMNASLLLQALLRFSRTSRLVNSLLSMSGTQLSVVCQSQMGCYVVDSLVTSAQLGEKGRTKLLDRLQEQLTALACSKHGSRVLETVWNACSIGQRCFIAYNLSSHQQKLRNDFFGRHAFRKFALELYSKKNDDWIAYIKREANKRKIFADLVPTPIDGSKKLRL